MKGFNNKPGESRTMGSVTVFHGKEQPEAVDELHREQARLLFRQAPVALVTALSAAIIAAFLFYHVVPQTWLIIWVATIVVITGVRMALIAAFRSADIKHTGVDRWIKRYTLGSVISGMAWGTAGLAFSADWPAQYQVLMPFILAGIVAGAMSSHSVVFRSFVGFQIPALAPIAVSLLFNGDMVYASMGAFIALYAAATLILARQIHLNIRNALYLRQENQELIDRLSNTNHQLEDEARERKQAVKELIREQRLFEEGPVVMFRYYAEHGWPIKYVSRAIIQFGFDAVTLMRERALFADLIYSEDLERVINSKFDIRQTTSLPAIEQDCRIVLPDGTIRWVYDYTIPVYNDSGAIIYFDGYILDITARKHAEQALNEEKERAQVTLHSIGDAVITTDVKDHVAYMNPIAEELTGWSVETAKGRSLSEVFCLVNGRTGALSGKGNAYTDDYREIDGAIQDHLLRRHDGHEYFVKLSRSPIRNREGNDIGAVIVLHDVTQMRNMAQQLSYQASHDPLTGLINRREFEQRLELALSSSRNEGRHHSVFYIDLDQFKVVNDTCGHGAGDELLRQLAEGFPLRLRDSDTLARLGGDEFGVLLENCPAERAVVVADALRAEVKETRFVWDDKVFEIGVSIGIVEITPEWESLATILSAADMACYAAKDLGRNRVHVYHGGDTELVRRQGEIHWVSKITQALEENRLVLYYQKIVPVGGAGTPIPHGEVLLRMLDREGNLVSPGLFLPAAERYNLMHSLDGWVVRNAFEWYAGQREHAGHDLEGVLSINLSGMSLGNESFLHQIISLFREIDIPPRVICFEITETAAIANLASASRFIRELRGLGCRFALDDFGSGLSSFGYLKNLPVDYLKIDGSFVRDIVDDPVDNEMVRSINQLGHVMEIETIAEFVENRQILARLHELGVDYAQGYGIEKPKLLEEVCWSTGQAKVAGEDAVMLRGKQLSR